MLNLRNVHEITLTTGTPSLAHLRTFFSKEKRLHRTAMRAFFFTKKRSNLNQIWARVVKVISCTFLIKIGLLLVLFLLNGCEQKKEIVSPFPLKNYDQNITTWIKPTDPDFHQPVINSEAQQKSFAIFYRHYFGTSSPWSATYINKILSVPATENLRATEESVIQSYSNKNKPKQEINYGENFRKHTEAWLKAISDNINISQFDYLQFNADNRAITLDNLAARALPTNDASFFSHRIAGQGYPFDNLQISSIWAGTPVYILGETKDRAWVLVLTPDFIGWVKSSGVARVDTAFIKKWAVESVKHFVAITHTKTSIIDSNGVFRFSAYVGAVFPGEESHDHYKIMIPIADLKQHASIGTALVSKKDAALMPMTTTPNNFSRIMKTLLGRPYGWGNLYFYNDCSSELKNLFTPFGIWLPRHSSDQVYAGKMTDLSTESVKNRIDYLMENGRPFSTLVYIDGHVFLFIGNFPNPNAADGKQMAMTFQNMWGLRPHPGDRRAVIGKSVLFPLLESFPEDSSLASQASKNHFKISQLDQAANNLLQLEIIDLKGLMFP